MMRKTPVALLTLMAASLVATAAYAHPKLTGSLPAADAVLTSPPKELRLSFNEGLIAKFSGVDVKDQQGKKIATGPATADPADAKQLVIPLPTALTAGTYTVEWHGVADDTHRIKGSYSFTVKP